MFLGGAGNDDIRAYLGRNVAIDAGDGNDFVGLNLGISNSIVTLGAGADRIELSMYVAPVVAFTITDFQAGDGGDAFSLTSALQRLVIGCEYGNPTVRTNAGNVRMSSGPRSYGALCDALPGRPTPFRA